MTAQSPIALVSSVRQLARIGWTVEFGDSRLPSEILARYGWVPAEVRCFVEMVQRASSRDQKAWLLGASDFSESTASAFLWNEWEAMSLAAAVTEGDARTVRHHWDQHFPVAVSVKSGYASFSLAKNGFGLVVGEEPEFEESRAISGSLAQFVEMIADRADGFDRWF